MQQYYKQVGIASGAAFLVLTLHTLLFTPTVIVEDHFVRPVQCVGGPKARPDIQWPVQHISANKVRFENGTVLYRNSVHLNGC